MSDLHKCPRCKLIRSTWSVKESSMSHDDREYDKTHLSIDTAEERGLIHRDYL